MFRRILHFIGKILLELLKFALILYFGFRIREYFVGIKYICYLEDNIPVKNSIKKKCKKDQK